MVCVRTAYVLALCSMLHMQHDYVPKKCFDLLIPSQGSRVYYTDKIFAAMLLHASFPLIGYAT